MKKYVTSFALIFNFLLSSCSSKLEDPASIPESETLQITSDRPNLKSGGKDYMNVKARVPKDAGKIDISFTTTGGTFVQSGTKSIKQLTDSLSGSYRYATVSLKSDTTSGSIYITAEAVTTRKRIIITFNK